MNAPFPFAFSEAPDAAEAVRDVAAALAAAQRQTAGAARAPAPLGLVYASSGFADDVGAIVETLRAATGVAAWTGAVGLGVIAGAREAFDAPALAAMLIDLPEDAVQPLSPIDNPAGFRAAAAQAAEFAGAAGAALGLIHVDPTGDPSGGGVANLPAELAEAGGLYLVGGLCSGREDMPAIDSAGAATGAVTGALVSLGSGVATGVSQGCAPIGPAREAEVAGVGVIARLGEMTAFEALMADVGVTPTSPPEAIRAALAGLHIALPVPGADRRDYVVRNITGLDPENGLVGVAAAMSDGDQAFFCRRDAASAAKDLEEMATATRKRLGREPRGALYVSCLARGPNLFGPNGEEVAIVRKALGADCPVVGFFANGEIAHDRLYGYTGVLTLFG